MATNILNCASRLVMPSLLLMSAFLIVPATLAKENLSAKSKEVYDGIKACSLTGGSAEVAEGLKKGKSRGSAGSSSGLPAKRDLIEQADFIAQELGSRPPVLGRSGQNIHGLPAFR